MRCSRVPPNSKRRCKHHSKRFMPSMLTNAANDFPEDRMKLRIAILMCVFLVSSVALAKTKKTTAAAALVPPDYKGMMQAEYDLWSTMESAKVAPKFATD